jgi:hypothetical protein
VCPQARTVSQLTDTAVHETPVPDTSFKTPSPGVSLKAQTSPEYDRFRHRLAECITMHGRSSSSGIRLGYARQGFVASPRSDDRRRN